MSCGYHNEYTGNKDDGNFYCNVCGNQVPIGFKHHHASEVPTLKKEIQELKEWLSDREGSKEHAQNSQNSSEDAC